MDFLPLVIRAEYREGYRIRLTFNDGRQRTVGFSGARIEPARPLGESRDWTPAVSPAGEVLKVERSRMS